jgi:hypothetical protein
LFTGSIPQTDDWKFLVFLIEKIIFSGVWASSSQEKTPPGRAKPSQEVPEKLSVSLQVLPI